MKKIICLLLTVFCLCGANAEDVLQILPQRVYAGSTSDDARSFTIQMNNDNVFLAFQFDLYLPEGMELDNEYDPFELSKDRFPYTEGRGGAIKFAHSVVYAKRAEGFYRVAVSANDLDSKVLGNSGDLLTVYYVTDENLRQGVLPVQIKNVVLAISGTEGVKPQPTSSFFYSGDMDLSTVESLDLSGLTNTMFRDVVEETNRLVGGNTSLTEIDVTGLDDAGAAFTSANKNCLTYVKGGSAVAERHAGMPNVVEVGETDNSCADFVLTDGCALNVSRPFTAAHAAYRRTVPGGGWYSLCLPYKANVPENVTVESFKSLDIAGSTVSFTPGGQEANVPCIFKATDGDIAFDADNVSVEATPEVPADGLMTGTYRLVPQGEITGCYALFADGSGFGKAGETAYVEPFHAYLRAEGSNARKITLVHDGVTAIDAASGNGLRISVNGGELVLSSEEGRRNVTIWSVDGRVADCVELVPGRTTGVWLQKGIYVIDKTKVIVR